MNVEVIVLPASPMRKDSLRTLFDNKLGGNHHRLGLRGGHQHRLDASCEEKNIFPCRDSNTESPVDDSVAYWPHRLKIQWIVDFKTLLNTIIHKLFSFFLSPCTSKEQKCVIFVTATFNKSLVSRFSQYMCNLNNDQSWIQVHKTTICSA